MKEAHPEAAVVESKAQKKELIPALLRILTNNSYTGLRTVREVELECYSDFRNLLFGLGEKGVKFLNQDLYSGEPMCLAQGGKSVKSFSLKNSNSD